MGGTLTLLIRHLVRNDVRVAGGRIARLYGINTLGAALGAFLTDFALVPAAGLLATQLAAVGFNVVAAVGALWLASRSPTTVRLASLRQGYGGPPKRDDLTRARRREEDTTHARTNAAGATRWPDARWVFPSSPPASLMLTGFAAMGMEDSGSATSHCSSADFAACSRCSSRSSSPASPPAQWPAGACFGGRIGLRTG